MAAAYDNYDYPSYWLGREYEHESEIVAIKEFLQKIPKIRRILDLGCGYGRLTPYYFFRAKRVVLADPSAKLLSLARTKLRSYGTKNKTNAIKFIQTRVENVNKKFKKESFDVVILVRVSHHLEDIDRAFQAIKKLLPKGGYLILEFPNKLHIKALFSRIIHGDLTFPIDIFPYDKRSTKHKKGKCIPFFNYHPEVIVEKLKKYGFKVVEKRSVSNVRSQLLKRYLPLESLLSLERHLQKPLGKINFGPSIFLLVKKT